MNTKVIPFIKVDPKRNERLEKKISAVFGSDDTFAGVIGVHPAFIGRVVNGEVSLTPEEKGVWASALKDSSAELFRQR